MNINDLLHGFRVLSIQECRDTGGVLIRMEHEKSGAQCIYHDRKDVNKTFAITFKTLPSDNTGVFHILEHSVLNGSRKYPVREPFVELLKGSLQTFLNAFTYPDKTMYPVSTRNDQDFLNLISVYMDAVLHPAIYENPNIFYQEGWHHEIRSAEQEPVYKGVVLNEMKGAYSSVDEGIVNTLNHIMFPDNCYQYESGGNPEEITDLTYEKFLETHQKYYHPSNARIWLDGTMDLDRVLKLLDEEYLCEYDRQNTDFTIAMQKEVAPEVKTFEYELGSDEDEKNRTQIAFGRIVSTFDQRKKNMAWSVLSAILVASNESPLKKAILEKDLGQDVELELFDGIQQPWAVLCVRNTEQKKLDEVRNTIVSSARDLVENGLDHDQIIACLNQMEFKYRERHEPAGLMYGQRAMDTWLYDGDPMQNLNIGHLFDELRRDVSSHYFEDVLAEFLLQDDFVTVVAVPSRTLGERRVEKEKEKLRAWKENEPDLSAVIEKNLALDAWQKQGDTAEQLATLPHLSLSDVGEKPFVLECEERTIKGIPVYLHPSEDSGIVYMNLYFSLAGITKEHLPSLAFYTSLFMNLRTRKSTLEQLQQKIRRDIGTLSFFVDAYTPEGTKDACIPVLGISCSVLKEKVDSAVSIIDEIIHETVYDKDTILPLLKQDNEEFRQSMISNGHALAARRAGAHYCAEGVFREYVNGYSSYVYEKKLEEQYETLSDEFVQECGLYTEVLFSRNRMTASITGEENLPIIEKMTACMSDLDGMRARVHYPYLTEKKEYLSIPGGVSYCVMANNSLSMERKPDTRMNVISHLLTYDWLWSEVRVKGGAYGTGMSCSGTGMIQAYSYRDPDVLNSMRAFKGCGEYLKQLVEEGTDLTQMIIGTIAEAEPLLSPNAAIRVADVWKFRQVDDETRCANRKKLLSMKTEDLLEFADLFTDGFADACICVVGSEETGKLLEGFTKINQ